MTDFTANPVITSLYEMYDQWLSWKEVARQLHVSPAYISDILNGRREISADFARKVGYKRIISFEKVAS